MGLVSLVLPPQSTSEKTRASFPVGSRRQQSGPSLSLTFFTLTKGVPSARPPLLCAPVPCNLDGPVPGSHHTHQYLSSTGETRRGCRSPDAVTKVPNKRGQHLYCFISVLFVAQSLEELMKYCKWTSTVHYSTSCQT